MTALVIDASVVAKWFFPEEYAAESRRLLSPRRTLLAPDLIWSEVGNIAWKRVRRGETSADEAAQLVADLIQMPLRVVPTQGLLASSLELAVATGRTVYDCTYLAMAIDRKCRLATADERLINALAATPFAKHIRHVARVR